ncbi:dnaJ domain-containing protein [Phthorimaea operculella]|nr:dnaJ domain-containing protein [Phthorimaea operculella]
MGIRWPDHSSKSPTGYRGSGMYCIEKKVLQEAGLVAVDTTGGYVVFGPVWRPQDLPEGDTVLYGSVLSEVLQRFWESEEPPTADRRKPEDDECELFYQYNTARCPSGRFVTRLPFLPNRPALVWRHVPGEWNPADCASRGCRAPDLVSHPLWWGPQWLTESPQEWPFNECRAPLGPPDRGLRVNVGQLVPKPNPAFLLERYSSLDKLLGVTGWIKRFVNNCRKPQAERNFTPVLSPAERNAALCSLVRVVQAEHFEEELLVDSYEFFNDLYHRFLSTPKVEMKCMCLQAMSIVYGRYFEDIGPFADTKYIVQMLDRTCDRMERDRLVQFLSKLILHRRNVSEILEWNGIRILVDLMTLAHLHTSRATVPAQSNVIEAPKQTQDGGGDKEWYYNVEQGDKVQRKGPVSFQQLKELYKSGEINNKTKCWANSMEGWRAVASVPQLKWTLVARGTAVMDESALAATVLDLLITCARYFPSRDEEDAVIRPLPKVKRLLSEPACLAHVVQLLLTFDPILVEKVATLLYEVMQDNPEISKLYLTGVFYFMLLYTGSNLLPIARFLRLTHMKQAFRADQSSSDIMQRSILGQLLPEAMVCYLENHGADKFAQIFLGEWDTPEAIWNSEMRRMLIMKVSAHIGEFTPRLRAHIAARYPYLAIPCVQYPQLERELFCNMFYLRHLCDTQKFPDWPIPDPVRLLKDVLEAWRREVEKKPPSMTAGEAYAALGLTGGQHDEAAVRKAYYRLAQQYHPDKNPEGRDRFEAVNQAYEFLCSRNVWTGDGPNTNNIVLILRTQTILFQRYSDVLAPYKYAGYPQLLSTARLEAEAEKLFAARDAPALLPAACELAHATVKCSALNAEELRREGGLQLLPAACELAHATVKCSALNAEELRREGGLQLLPAACELAHATVKCSALNAEELRRREGCRYMLLYGSVTAATGGL